MPFTEGSQPPREVTRAQQQMMLYMLGKEGFNTWIDDFYPSSITLPRQISSFADTMFRISVEDSREHGWQHWWEHEGRLARNTPIPGADETGTITQSMLRDARFAIQRVPTLDIHTHPKQLNPDKPNNFARAQFPSDHDIRAFVELDHILLMAVRSEAGLSCLVKPRAEVAGEASGIDLTGLDRMQPVANNALLTSVGRRLARALGPGLGLYHSFSSDSGEMQYISPMKMPKQT